MTTAAAEYKRRSQDQWNANPCGEVAGEPGSREYFLAVERNRYEEYAPWMRPYFRYLDYAGKRVLEIGYGQGTDLCQFAAAGAECHGVDITPAHFELATRNLELRGHRAELHLEDASKLHFEDDTFDVVYSFGVLHHTPDTNRCIAEAHRVLKPGELLLALYHRRSAAYVLSTWLLNGILRGKLWKLGREGLLSTIERGADGIRIKPLVKLYSRAEIRLMLSDFSAVSVDVRHLPRRHLPVVGALAPAPLIRLLERRLGWFVIGRAVK